MHRLAAHGGEPQLEGIGINHDFGSSQEHRMDLGTFNPGWDSNANKLSDFTDIRELQRRSKAKGVQFMTEADESTTGPASFVILDPDRNPILVDQHA